MALNPCRCHGDLYTSPAVKELTKEKNGLQQRLRHIPADSLGSRILRDVVVEGTIR